MEEAGGGGGGAAAGVRGGVHELALQTATDAARIKDIVISETDYTAQQIKIMEAN